MHPQRPGPLRSANAVGDGNTPAGHHPCSALAPQQAASRLVAAFVAACLAGLSVIAPVIGAAPGDRPGIFLEGASVPRAKGLALDAALIKGWHVAETARNHVVFETILEEPASPGPPNAVAPDYTLLRIRADFIETPAGVNAYLYAQEIWYAGSSKEWSTDVTSLYRANLTHALTSLQSQWSKPAATRPTEPPSGEASDQSAEPAEPAYNPAAAAMATPQPKIRVAPVGTFDGAPAAPPIAARPPAQTTPPPSIDVEVGTWAYHAEEFAVGRGCTLDEIGAELVSGDSASELHRVHCQDGSVVLVRCDRETCVDGR